MSRFAFISLLSAIILLVALVVHFSQRSAHEEATETLQAISEPDIYIYSAAGKQFNLEGNLGYEFTARSIQRFPDDENTLVDKPDIKLIQEGGSTWYISADHGTSDSDFTKVFLQGDVELRHNTESSEVVVQTSAATWTPEQERVFTDQDVMIKDDYGVLNAKSADIDLANSRYLLGKGTGKHKPINLGF